MTRKKKDSDIAQHLMDSLLDDVEQSKASYNEPPSANIFISAGAKEAEIRADGTLWNKVRQELGEEEQISEPEVKSEQGPGPEEKDERTLAVVPSQASDENEDDDLGDSTKPLGLNPVAAAKYSEHEETIIAPTAKPRSKKDPTTKVRFGAARSASVPLSQAKSYANPDASLIQAENLRVAQDRILELEAEAERLRSENEELASAGETLKDRADELFAQVENLERIRASTKKDLENEIHIYKERVRHRDAELNKLKMKNAELEARLQRDLKKVRVRERELENRLELARLENAALVRAKDDTILDLKRRIDQLESEAEAYRQKCQELNHQIDSNQDQFRRTVKALRLALTNLEVDEEGLAPLKKAE